MTLLAAARVGDARHSPFNPESFKITPWRLPSNLVNAKLSQLYHRYTLMIPVRYMLNMLVFAHDSQCPRLTSCHALVRTPYPVTSHTGSAMLRALYKNA